MLADVLCKVEAGPGRLRGGAADRRLSRLLHRRHRRHGQGTVVWCAQWCAECIWAVDISHISLLSAVLRDRTQQQAVDGRGDARGGASRRAGKRGVWCETAEMPHAMGKCSNFLIQAAYVVYNSSLCSRGGLTIFDVNHA